MKKTIYTVIIIILSVIISFANCNLTGYRLPECDKAEISDILSKDSYDTSDYKFLSEQTGICTDVIKDMIAKGNKETILRIHELYFKKPDYSKSYILYPFTFEERNTTQITPIVPLKNGDILFTRSTASLNWRHGHCAIVTDAENGLMLEHACAGAKSCFDTCMSWGTYPSFAVLRYKDEVVAGEAAKFACEKLLGVDYNIFAGIITKDKSEQTLPASHCSHIVWQAYKAVGVDIDRDKGFTVTPENIFDSEKFEIIQRYGI